MLQLKTICGNGVLAIVGLMLAYPATAQPIPVKSRDACIQRTAEEMVVAARDITVTGAGPVDASSGVRTLFMRNTVTGQTAECRVNTIDAYVLSVTVMGGGTGGTGSTQPISVKSRDACIQRTAEEIVVAARDITVTGAGPIDAESGARTLFMRNTKTGQTAECRVNTISNTVLSVNMTGGGNPTPPPSGSTPTEGNFAGRGTASGAVFGGGQRVDADLSFNRNNFSLGLAVPPGTGVQVRYQGTINQIRSTNSNNPNSFVIDGRLESFASSANGLRVINTAGTCRIEVSDARITATSCNTTAPNASTRFVGMSQF